MDPSINVHFLCRLCGSKTKELQRINMFESAGELLEVKSKIKFCLGMTIHKKDNLPQVLCTECVDNVNNYTRFKENAEKTTDLLQGLFSQQDESVENSQNSCNIEDDSIFDTANYISDPEELIIKPDDSDSVLDQTNVNPLVIDRKKRSTKRKRSKTSQKRSKKHLKLPRLLRTSNNEIDNEGTRKRSVVLKPRKATFSSYDCDICEKTFQKRTLIYKHMSRHFVDRNKNSKSCFYCFKKFKSKSVLTKHIKSKHEHTKNIKIHIKNCENNVENSTVAENTEPEKKISVKRTQKIKPSSYECDLCKREFRTRYYIYRHLVRHLTNNSKSKKKVRGRYCSYCKKEFRSNDTLTKHINSFHKKNIKENNENNSVNIASLNVEHKKTNSVKRNKKVVFSSYECDICQKIYQAKYNIYRHMVRHFTIKPKKRKKVKPTCSYCGKQFSSDNELTRHVKSKHEKVKKVREPKIFICHHCGKTFNDSSRFKYHLNTKHPEDFSFECEKCNKKFAIKELLRSHIYNMHNDNKLQWICDVCGKSLSSKHSYTKHKMRHDKTPEELKALKTCICLVCGAAYDHPCNLRYHMRMHTGETSFECNICKRRFIRRNALNIHILTHTGERNFVCDVCNKAFAIKKNLDIHKLIHTGERRFQCNDCDKTYTQNSTLNIHLKKTGHTRKKL